MRQQLSDQLCIQEMTDLSSLASRTEHLEWAASTRAAEDLQCAKISGNSELGDVGCVGGENTDKSLEAPGRADANSPVYLRLNSPLLVDLGLVLRDSDVLANDLEITRDAAMNKDVIFVETLSRKDSSSGGLCSLHETNSLLEKCADEEEKWYVNPMVDAVEDYFDTCTPERKSSLLSTYTPRRAFELMALRSSIKKSDKWNSGSRLSQLGEFSPASPLQVMGCYLSNSGLI